jgi:hypothetical protein
MQTILAILTISAAVFFFLRRIYKQFYGKKEGCEGCGMNG